MTKRQSNKKRYQKRHSTKKHKKRQPGKHKNSKKMRMLRDLKQKIDYQLKYTCGNPLRPMIKCIRFLPNYQYSREEFGPSTIIYKLRNPYHYSKLIIRKLNVYCYFTKHSDLIHDIQQLIFELYNDIDLDQIYEKKLKQQLWSRNGDLMTDQRNLGLSLIKNVEFSIGGMRY